MRYYIAQTTKFKLSIVSLTSFGIRSRPKSQGHFQSAFTRRYSKGNLRFHWFKLQSFYSDNSLQNKHLCSFFLMKTFLSVGEWIFKHLVICQLTSVLFCLGNQIHPSVICINLPVFILNLPGSIISKFWYLHKYNVTLLFHLLPDFNLRWLCQHFWQSNLYSLFCFFDFV